MPPAPPRGIAMTLIVNRYGIFHEVPDTLLAIVERQGGHVATEGETAAFEGGATRMGDDAIVIEPEASALEPPMPDYDDLNADQVVARLANLTPDKLVAVYAYETVNKRRKTVLSAIDSR